MSKCGYKHHEDKEKKPTAGKELGKCPTHGEDLICGPFYHSVCLKCEPSLARRCGICKDMVRDCCC